MGIWTPISQSRLRPDFSRAAAHLSRGRERQTGLSRSRLGARIVKFTEPRKWVTVTSHGPPSPVLPNLIQAACCFGGAGKFALGFGEAAFVLMIRSVGQGQRFQCPSRHCSNDENSQFKLRQPVRCTPDAKRRVPREPGHAPGFHKSPSPESFTRQRGHKIRLRRQTPAKQSAPA